MDPFFQKNHDFQHSILYGALLGDAYLYPQKGIIQLEQCVEHQFEKIDISLQISIFSSLVLAF